MKVHNRAALTFFPITLLLLWISFSFVFHKFYGAVKVLSVEPGKSDPICPPLCRQSRGDTCGTCDTGALALRLAQHMHTPPKQHKGSLLRIHKHQAYKCIHVFYHVQYKSRTLCIGTQAGSLSTDLPLLKCLLMLMAQQWAPTHTCHPNPPALPTYQEPPFVHLCFTTPSWGCWVGGGPHLLAP